MEHETWIFILLGVAIGLLLLVVFIVDRVHEKVSEIHDQAGGVQTGDIAELQKDIEGVRNHISSNHDETDGELRRLAESTEAIARDVHVAGHRRFEQEIGDELARIRGKPRVKDDTQ